MTGGETSTERRVLGLPIVGAEPTAEEADRARRTVEALERLRSQLVHTQGALDEYLERLDAHAGESQPTAG